MSLLVSFFGAFFNNSRFNFDQFQFQLVSNRSNTLSKQLSTANMVVSSAKLYIAVSATMKKRSLLYTLTRRGPRTEPCGAPVQVSRQLMNEPLNFTLYFLPDI